jgi:hypothetical protein
MAPTKAVPKIKKKSNNNLKSASKPASQTRPDSGKKNEPGRKPGCKSSGRKATAKITNPEDTSIAPEVAGSNLRNAINIAVASQSDRIASALIHEAVLGNMGSAKILIDISGARNPEPKKKAKGPSLADELRMEEQWQGPPDGDLDADLGVPFGRREPFL